MTSTTTTVLCPECRRENEPERVYCHSCGARLDRNAVKVSKENVQDTRDRVKKLFDPQRAKARALFFKISKVVLGACALAVVVQMVLPPDAPALPKADLIASQMRFELENAATRHQPAQLRYTDEQVNAFLIYALKTKRKSLDHPLIDFKRASVVFNEAACSFIVERSFFGYSFYTTLNLSPTVTGGKMVAATKGGRIGRLPVDPKIAQYMGVLSADVRSALDSEAKLVAKMRGIEFHDKAVVLTAAP
jgi:hypothetical protein